MSEQASGQFPVEPKRLTRRTFLAATGTSVASGVLGPVVGTNVEDAVTAGAVFSGVASLALPVDYRVRAAMTIASGLISRAIWSQTDPARVYASEKQGSKREGLKWTKYINPYFEAKK